MNITNENVIEIPCLCGFNLAIREFDMDEIAAGVWGSIFCPKCKAYLNPKIKEIYNAPVM